LLREIEKLAGDNDLRQKMSGQSRRIGRPEAGELIAGILRNAGKKSLCTFTDSET